MLEAILFPTAALLYTFAIGKEHWQRQLKQSTVWVFAVALTIDGSATFFVCVLKAKTLVPTFHGFMGWLALLIMALHFSWALKALNHGGAAIARFHRWSPTAWIIWIVSFISGIPK